jgi:hypothetical protein
MTAYMSEHEGHAARHQLERDRCELAVSVAAERTAA